MGTGRRLWPDRARWRLLRRTLRRILTEQSSPSRLGWAVGIGVFIAVTPLYGLHSIMAIGAATALRLNRAITLLATAFPLPIFQPLLALGGLQIGALALSGEFVAMSLETVADLDPWLFVTEWAIGTLILGTILGLPLGIATTVMAKRYRRQSSLPAR